MKLLFSIGGVWHIKNGIAQFNSRGASFTSSFSWSHGVEIISEGAFSSFLCNTNFFKNFPRNLYDKLIKSRENEDAYSSYILRRPHNFQ